MHTFYKIILFFAFLVTSESVFSQKVFYTSKVDKTNTFIGADSSGLLYTVYLIGDIKQSETGKNNLSELSNYISKADSNSAVIVLGDIIYPLGLPDSSNTKYAEAEHDLKQVLNSFNNYKGNVYFIPGNHDWANGRKQGWKYVTNEERYIEDFNPHKNIYLPNNGCPGPVEVKLTNDLTLIIIDSQWWFQKNSKPQGDNDCGFANSDDLFLQIEDALKRNKDKKVIFAAHHPLYSVGEHGGYFPVSYLAFPLLEIKNWMYIPLPGFLYTDYRKYLGDVQDLANPDYKYFRETLINIFSNYPNVIYASGHEHNLQYFSKDSLHHIISGGGGDASYIARKSNKTDFACQCPGFVELSFFKNGDVNATYISTYNTDNAKVIYSKKLFSKPLNTDSTCNDFYKKNDFKDSSVIVSISNQYEVGKFHEFMMGTNYRNVWNAKVKLPVFDIGSEKGGLSIIKRGGGMQTRSIRMVDSTGKQYVLRSVNKYVEKALPEYLRNTIALKPLQDGISASNPFAAITVPVLADAAGVMHTNPKLFWVPNDPQLGIYNDELAEDVYLFEERPTGNMKDEDSFGNSKKIISTPKVIHKIQEDHKHSVDQKAVVRTRLFDMLINDWDRHDDQWRWASFKSNKKTIYRPIPRDRDQVYFVNQGLIMWLATLTWPTRKFQGFDYTIKDVKGLGFNARYFDRTFITQPDLNDWIQIANELKNNISDSIIHEAITKLPDNIYDSIGADIEEKLKSRRNLLPGYAEEYYKYLSKTVDVVGTKKNELFNVQRQNNGDVNLSIYALSNKKRKVKEQLYSREFKYGETNEIRLYGLSGKDVFKVSGSGKKGIKIRIIGGKGNDSIIDESKVGGLGKKTIVYDRKDKNNVVIKGRETRVLLSNKNKEITYNRKQFKYNKAMPLIWAGYNIDDGIFVGGGVKITRFNFNDSTINRIKGNLAFQTDAFAIDYEGLFTSVSQIFDLSIKANISFPRNVDNFYGLGNETKKITDDSKYYRVRYKYAWVNPMLLHTVNRKLNYSFGGFYQYFMVTDTTGRYIADIYPLLLDSSAFLSHNYLGVNAKISYDSRDNKIIPKRGVVWESEILGYYSIADRGKNFIKIKSNLSVYLSFRKDPRIVFAFRVGGASNIGDYEFFHANFLGGKTNLRGYRSNRFAGDNSLYFNSEIRVKLFDVKSYIFNGQLGISVFNDTGRVWYNNQKSKQWHNGYGLELWFTPFDFTAITVSYNRSKEDSFVDFKFSYLF